MFLFESTICLSHHSRSFTSTSMQSEAYGTNMYRVLLFLYPSYFPNVCSFYKDRSSSMLRPPHLEPTRVPQFLTELRSPRDTRASAAASPQREPRRGPLPRTGTSASAATGASRADRQRPTPAASRSRRSCSKSAPRAHRVGRGRERAWRKRARGLGEGRRRDGWGEGWMRGRLERILLKELLGEWAKRAEERGREGTLHQKKLTCWNKFNCNKI